MLGTSRHFRHVRLIAGLLPWCLGAQQPGAPTGTVTGRIVEAGSQRPLSDVQVSVVGTQRGGISNDQGDYRIAGLTLGPITLRVQRIGYAPVTQSIVLGAGTSAPTNFVMSPTAIQIDEVVITATGESQRKRESGNTIATITPT